MKEVGHRVTVAANGESEKRNARIRVLNRIILLQKNLLEELNYVKIYRTIMEIITSFRNLFN